VKLRFSKDFTIDSQAAPWRVEGLRIGFFGAPGSGKSYCAAVVVEQFLDQGGTVVVFQPRAEWHTLKHRYGQVQVVGGPFNQDVPFIASEPRLYADAVVHQGVSMVFYTGDVEDEEQLVKFASRFVSYLLRFEETVKRPILLVIEEAQEYAPRTSQGRVAPPWVYNRMIKQFKDCFTQGRKLNVSPIVISQRPQEVNFTIRQLCNLTLYGKFAPQDINYIDRECLKPYRDKGVAADASQLLDLQAGQWLIIHGAQAAVIDVTVKRRTPHGADTPTLEDVAPPSREVKQTVSDLGKRLQAMLEKRTAEKSELEKAKRKIRELERDVENLKKKADVAVALREGFQGMGTGGPEASSEGRKPKRGEMTSFYEGEIGNLTTQLKAKTQRVLQLEESLKEIQPLRDVLTALLKPSIEEIIDQKMGTSQDKGVIPAAFPKADIVENLPRYENRIHHYLASHRGIAFSRYQIATALRIGPKSSRYTTALKRLTQLKLIKKTKEGYAVHG
jgi:hypothetical protein